MITINAHTSCHYPRCCTVAAFAGRLGFTAHATSMLATGTRIAVAALLRTARDLGLRGEA